MSSNSCHNRTASNPYAAPEPLSFTETEPPRLPALAWIAIVCCLTSIGFWLVVLIVSLPYGDPSAPPLKNLIGLTFLFMVLPGVGLFGAVAMLKRERYWIAVAAAAAMMVPVLGPCFGLTLPIGIWILVCLRQHVVRRTFSISTTQAAGRSGSTAALDDSKHDRLDD